MKNNFGDIFHDDVDVHVDGLFGIHVDSCVANVSGLLFSDCAQQ